VAGKGANNNSGRAERIARVVLYSEVCWSDGLTAKFRDLTAFEAQLSDASGLRRLSLIYNMTLQFEGRHRQHGGRNRQDDQDDQDNLS
jgi:hypothetical protein